MASEKQITVGGVAIGGGAPVVVQSMTTTETADVDGHAGSGAGAGRGRVRPGAGGGAGTRRRGCAAGDRGRLAAAGDRGHPLQRLARPARDGRGRRRRAHQPRQHRRAGQGRAGRAAGQADRHADADRRQLRVAARPPAPVRDQRSGRRAGGGGAGGGAAAGAARVPRVQDLGEVVVGARDGAGLPAPERARPLSAAPGRDGGRPGLHGHGQELDRHRHAAGTGHRRHDPRVADRRPGGGGAGGAGRSCGRWGCASAGR